MSLLDNLLNRGKSVAEIVEDKMDLSQAVSTVLDYYILEKEEGTRFGTWGHESNTLLLLPVLEQGIGKDFEPNTFLDELVTGMDYALGKMLKRKETRHTSDFHAFLAMVVQGLYCKDYNDFELDLRPLAKYFGRDRYRFSLSRDEDFGYRLFGAEDRLLRLKLLGDVEELGQWCEYCVIEFEGSAESIGKHAEDSRFILSGDIGEVGNESENCVYELESPVTIAILGKENKVYARNGLTELKGGILWDFFDQNELYIPQGAGWKQVHSAEEVVLHEP